MKRDPKTGSVLIDYNICVGCRICVSFCPFGGVGIDVKTGRVVKCDLCDGEPKCVKFCDPAALLYIDSTTVNMMKRKAAAERFSELMRKLLATI